MNRQQTHGLQGPGGDPGTKLLKVGWREEMTLVRRGDRYSMTLKELDNAGSRLRAKRLGRQGRKVGWMPWTTRIRNRKWRQRLEGKN